MRSQVWLPLMLVLVVAVVIGIIVLMPGDNPSGIDETDISKDDIAKSSNESVTGKSLIAKDIHQPSETGKTAKN